MQSEMVLIVIIRIYTGNDLRTIVLQLGVHTGSKQPHKQQSWGHAHKKRTHHCGHDIHQDHFSPITVQGAKGCGLSKSMVLAVPFIASGDTMKSKVAMVKPCICNCK
jgi:hypothetical protein